MIPQPAYDVAIAGAGLIGLSLALELHARGASVAVFDTARPMRQTSIAAAGMLAADDPHNPAALHGLSTYSIALYPAFLDRIATLSGISVPFQTSTTIQHLDDGTTRLLAENSIDPRQLGPAVLHAARQTGITLHEDAHQVEIHELPNGIHVRPLHGPALLARQLVHASGAWFQGPPAVVKPRKGQMLRVRLPSILALHEVHRSQTIYIVPRTQGPQAGTALIGATDEDAGFDLSTHPADLDRLRTLAANLLPALAPTEDAPQVEAWAGLRPGTPDDLPLLGRLPHSARRWAATGHYRNGILLAPATAAVLADLLEGKLPAVDLRPFSTARF
ncbi:MAG TPA: FAD-dependent oxidoreductase [Acidobacteriaceae bacterium]